MDSSGVIEGANSRPISRTAAQKTRTEVFARHSSEIEATGEVPFGYDDLEDWFETQVAEFRRLKLPIPERPGFMRSDEWTVELVQALREQLGRKFEADDVTPGLRRFATTWVRELPTPIDFEFLASIRFDLEVNKGRSHVLTVGQAKGVLNCVVARKPKAATQTKTEPVEIEDGLYLKDGRIYKVVHAVHGSGHQYAKVLVSQGRDERARYEYAKGIIRELTPADRMTLDQAVAIAGDATHELYGHCVNCGAVLTDETSIGLAIGPVCRGKLL